MPNDDAPGPPAGQWQEVAAGRWELQDSPYRAAVVAGPCGYHAVTPESKPIILYHRAVQTLAEAQAACEEAARLYVAELRTEVAGFEEA